MTRDWDVETYLRVAVPILTAPLANLELEPVPVSLAGIVGQFMIPGSGFKSAWVSLWRFSSGKTEAQPAHKGTR